MQNMWLKMTVLRLAQSEETANMFSPTNIKIASTHILLLLKVKFLKIFSYLGTKLKTSQSQVPE